MSVEVPAWTVEKPLTALDYISALQKCVTVREVGQFGDQCPEKIVADERFSKAVAKRLHEIHESRPMKRVA